MYYGYVNYNELTYENKYIILLILDIQKHHLFYLNFQEQNFLLNMLKIFLF
jgi:hypothetical protein